MILYLYSEIAKLLTQQLPNESLWIDLDRGQLEDPESFESLIIPAILVNMPQIEWQTLGQRNQIGDTTFTLKVVISLPEPTYNINNVNINLEAITIEDRIHKAITAAGIMRTGTRSYPVSTYFVIEHRYMTTTDYVSTTITKPLGDLSLQTNSQLIK